MLKELYDASYSLPSEGDWLNIDGVGTVPNNVCSRAAAEIERLRAALEKYADPNYNGYNGGPEHAERTLRPNGEQARTQAEEPKR